MIVEAVKRYFERSCPLVSGKKLNVSCLDEKVHSCVIVPERPAAVIKKYPDGGSLRQFVFEFSTREFFDACSRDNLAVAAFYEKFAQWIEEQNESGVLPELGAGLSSVGFELMTSGYLFDAMGKTAKYSIKLRLIYEKI